MAGVAVSTSQDGPGAALRAAREQRDISIREVAEVLNLPSHIVEAIESNDYDALPNAVFTKGYIRGYARLLELDSDPLVAEYPADPSITLEQEPVVADRLMELARENPQWVLGGGVALAAVVLVTLLAWLWPSGDVEVAQPAPVAAQATDPVMPPAAEPPSMQAVELGPAGAGPALAEPGASAPVAAPTPAASTAATPAPVAPEPDTDSVAGVGADRLRFGFTGECWVEVQGADGRTLYSDLRRAGQTLELSGRAPFRILLGYAPGVSLTFNGEPVALAPHTRNNVANLVLGQ